MARMYEIHREIAGAQESTLVVRTLEEALAWLGIDAFAVIRADELVLPAAERGNAQGPQSGLPSS